MVCERHEEVMEYLDDHEDRIKYLELADTETKVEIKNLIKQVERLVATMEKYISYIFRGLIAFCAVGGGFIIWYIQNN